MPRARTAFVSVVSIETVSNISKFREELEQLIKVEAMTHTIVSQDPAVEEATVFALVKQSESLWSLTGPALPLEEPMVFAPEESGFQQSPTVTGLIDQIVFINDMQEFLAVAISVDMLVVTWLVRSLGTSGVSWLSSLRTASGSGCRHRFERCQEYFKLSRDRLSSV